MELALRRAYGYAFGPKIRKRAGFGMGFLGDDTTLDDTGDGTVSAQDTTNSLYAGLIAQGVDPADASAYISTVPTVTVPNAGSITVQSTTASDLAALQASGASCSSSGDCVLTPAQAASASASGSTALAGSIAAAAAAIAKTVSGVGTGSIQCGNGQAVAIGQSCPGAPVGSVCPTGFTLSGTTCTASLVPGLSNSTLVLIGIAFVAFMAFSGKK
jgi:hypothetical protein